VARVRAREALRGFEKTRSSLLNHNLCRRNPLSLRFNALRAGAHIPGANIKEFLGTILSEPKRQKIPRLSWDGEFLERKAADQKFFSVSGMGFGQQPKRH